MNRLKNHLQFCFKFFLFFSFLWIQSCMFGSSGNVRDYKNYLSEQKQTNSVPSGKVRVTFLGTSSLLVDDGETQLLTDGFFTRPSLFRTAFLRLSTDISIIESVMAKTRMNRLKGIFVCHSHYDHAMDAPFVAKLTGANLYGSSSTLNVGAGAGLSFDRMNLFIPGKPVRIGKFTVTVLSSKHTPPFKILGKTNATDPNHPNIDSPLIQPAKASDYIEGGAFDFLIQHGSHSLLIKGSTNYIEGALDRYKVDVLFLGIAQLSKQPETFQETYYKETVKAVKAKQVIPIHWDNFFKPLAEPLEPNLKIGDDFNANMNFILHKTKADNVNVILLQGFETIDLF
ncbi:MBL fold metallo-hydrolase [Leptospira ilyithenensis]|uniref:MBL fold metallo-hydrolase n=1 Tax=Leptospira ilyithenensis TaxID=2484901 RepID=A0A4R9LQY2_9LEPT|nr:MBL fold metallo-hydrolase [Leptospira ilyithenensis]TGN12004.1 MBL fold metallo-hydrolase [Leptospira ilyithenensis]